MIFVQHFAVYAALRIKTAEVTCDNEMHQLESLLVCFHLTFFCCKKHSQHHLAAPDFQAKNLHLKFHRISILLVIKTQKMLLMETFTPLAKI